MYERFFFFTYHKRGDSFFQPFFIWPAPHSAATFSKTQNNKSILSRKVSTAGVCAARQAMVGVGTPPTPTPSVERRWSYPSMPSLPFRYGVAAPGTPPLTLASGNLRRRVLSICACALLSPIPPWHGALLFWVAHSDTLEIIPSRAVRIYRRALTRGVYISSRAPLHSLAFLLLPSSSTEHSSCLLQQLHTRRSRSRSRAPDASVKERTVLPSAISMIGKITSYQNTQRWKSSSLCPTDYVHLPMPVSMIEVAKEVIDASTSARGTKPTQTLRSMVLATTCQGTPKPHQIRFALHQQFDPGKPTMNALSMPSLLTSLPTSTSPSPVSPVLI